MVEKVARFDLLAIPVVDSQRRACWESSRTTNYRRHCGGSCGRCLPDGATDPLETSCILRTSLLTLSWKRGIWVTILFFARVLTAYAMHQYEEELASTAWLVLFIRW